MTWARTNPWRTFLLAALGINALCFALVRAVPRPEVAFGAALDVAITVPALYLLLVVRAGLAPAISAIPLVLLGLLRATYLAHGIAPARPLIAGAAEIAVVWAVVSRVRRGLRSAGSGDMLLRLERAAAEVVPSRRVAAVLGGELAVFWYGLLSWRSAPDVPEGARAYMLHRENGIALLFGFLAGVSVMEATLVHLIVARWSPVLAWILTGLSLYGGLWLAAVARSFSLRPVLVSDDWVTVRIGLLWTLQVPRRAVTIASAGTACDVRVPFFSEPNTVLRLDRPATAQGLYGMTRRVLTVGLTLDEAGGFTVN